MGCCCGSSAFDLAKQCPTFKQDLVHFNAMKLTERDVRRLFYIFKKVDVDGSGSVALEELIVHVDLPFTSFTEKVFSIFDDDQSGEIDFKEFVLALWNYCTLTAVTLDMFAFDLYDSDGSEELSAGEVTRMLEDIFGKSELRFYLNVKVIHTALQEIEKAHETFTVDKFRNFVKTHQAMLFPTFQMQLALQRKFLGVAFWEGVADRRMDMCEGKYVSVSKFIVENSKAKCAFDNENARYDNAKSKKDAKSVHASGPRGGARRTSVGALHSKHRSSNQILNTYDSYSSKPAAVLTALSESAKLRWRASVSGVQGLLVGSSAKLSRKAGARSPTRVHVAPKVFGTNAELSVNTPVSAKPSPTLSPHGVLSGQASSYFSQISGDLAPTSPPTRQTSTVHGCGSSAFSPHSTSSSELTVTPTPTSAQDGARHRRGRKDKEEKDFEGPINALMAQIASPGPPARALGGSSSHNAHPYPKIIISPVHNASSGHHPLRPRVLAQSPSKTGRSSFFQPMEGEYDKRRRSITNDSSDDTQKVAGGPTKLNGHRRNSFG